MILKYFSSYLDIAIYITPRNSAIYPRYLHRITVSEPLRLWSGEFHDMGNLLFLYVLKKRGLA